MNKKYIFRIYIAGIAPDVQTQIVNLKDQLNNVLGPDQFSLKVIDILETPEIAEEEHILATPTIVRQEPAPIKKLILNFNRGQNVELNLDLIIKD